MSQGTKIVLGMSLFFLVLIGGVLGYVFSSKFTASKFENGLVAQNKKMQSVHSSGKNSLKMQTSTVKNYTQSDLNKVEALIKKYEGKPNLLMLSVKENSQGLSPELHKELMDAIQKYYVKWDVVQQSLFSMTQEYENFLGASVKGSVASMLGFPSEKAKKLMEQVISSKDTVKVFATGMDEAEDLFKE